MEKIKEKTCIIGNGEIGQSLGNVLSEVYDVEYTDIDTQAEGQFDVINICIPYSKAFVDEVQNYIGVYAPKLCIIHSTVPPGTTDECGDICVHSPVHGKHPNLENGIKTFKKYIGGKSIYRVYDAIRYLLKAGIDVKAVQDAKTSEMSKIMCTTYYGWNLVFMKEMVKICEKEGVNFDEVYGWNEWYNTGYRRMGADHFTRPVLTPTEGPIGGHCVLPNCDLYETFLTQTVKEKGSDDR